MAIGVDNNHKDRLNVMLILFYRMAHRLLEQAHHKLAKDRALFTWRPAARPEATLVIYLLNNYLTAVSLKDCICNRAPYYRLNPGWLPR